jgi:hypothetical protein
MSYYDVSTVRMHLTDSSRMLADLTAEMVYEKPELMECLMDLAWIDEEPWSQRASRVVSICCCRFPEMVMPFISQIIKRLNIQKSEGSRRNFLKIFVDTDIVLKKHDRSTLLNACFDFLTGNYSIAVKVYSMDILFKMSREFPDIRKELHLVILGQFDDASPGFRSHASKIMKKMEKLSNSRISGIDGDR